MYMYNNNNNVIYLYVCVCLAYTGQLGIGVYFYTKPEDAITHQCGTSGPRWLYRCAVLTGTCGQGATGLKEPPPRDPAKVNVLHDCVVDNVQNPQVYVAFYDHQCYPHYLVTFT